MYLVHKYSCKDKTRYETRDVLLIMFWEHNHRNVYFLFLNVKVEFSISFRDTLFVYFKTIVLFELYVPFLQIFTLLSNMNYCSVADALASVLRPSLMDFRTINSMADQSSNIRKATLPTRVFCVIGENSKWFEHCAQRLFVPHISECNISKYISIIMYLNILLSCEFKYTASILHFTNN